MAAPVVIVSADNAETGEHSEEVLDIDGYVIVAGKNMHVDAVTKYRNGTIVLTIKRRVA